MIDLALTDGLIGAARKPVATLAALELRQLGERIDTVLEQSGGSLDVYSVAHLEDARLRIKQALNAMHVYE
jgi:hypothetical protein